MKTFKLFLSSLVSNNSSIDGGRKKPWYLAVIMLFASLVLSLVPTTVKRAQRTGVEQITSTTYSLRESTYEFAEELNKPIYENSAYIAYSDTTSENYFVSGEFIEYNHTNATTNDIDLVVKYIQSYDAEVIDGITKDKNVNFIVFTEDEIIFNIATEDKASPTRCADAYKYMAEGTALKSFLVTGENKTDSISKTWANWFNFYKNAYNATRITGIWLNLAIYGTMYLIIVVLMGFMIWVLCRGKNNPYRLFSFWECQKMCWWASVTPGILACALGFLFKNFAEMLFILFLGVRIMWLSLKSLRPDGSGYAAN